MATRSRSCTTSNTIIILPWAKSCDILKAEGEGLAPYPPGAYWVSASMTFATSSIIAARTPSAAARTDSRKASFSRLFLSRRRAAPLLTSFVPQTAGCMVRRPATAPPVFHACGLFSLGAKHHGYARYSCRSFPPRQRFFQRLPTLSSMSRFNLSGKLTVMPSVCREKALRMICSSVTPHSLTPTPCRRASSTSASVVCTAAGQI